MSEETLDTMIITIGGELGAGKTSVGRLLASKLGFEYKCGGDFMGEMAHKRGISLLELTRQANTDPAIDSEIDHYIQQLERSGKNLVVDARLGFYFIPKSLKVYLKVDPAVGARRAFESRKQRTDEPENTDLATTMRNQKERYESERYRYQRSYSVDPANTELYDIVIDTTTPTVPAIVDQILSHPFFSGIKKSPGRIVL